MIEGTLKATGVAVGEFSCSVLGATVKLTAKAAFVDPRAGHTHGWTSCDSWSQTTMEKMREFIGAMELDLARQHFSGFTSPNAGVTDVSQTPGIAEGGLGEHVASEGEQV